jgi:hypothetical protein
MPAYVTREPESHNAFSHVSSRRAPHARRGDQRTGARTRSRSPCEHRVRWRARRRSPSDTSSTIGWGDGCRCRELRLRSNLKSGLASPFPGSGQSSHARLCSGSQAPRKSRRLTSDPASINHHPPDCQHGTGHICAVPLREPRFPRLPGWPAGHHDGVGMSSRKEFHASHQREAEVL